MIKEYYVRGNDKYIIRYDVLGRKIPPVVWRYAKNICWWVIEKDEKVIDAIFAICDFKEA